MLSTPQKKVLQTLNKHKDYGRVFLGGNKRAHVLSAARALVRKGFAFNHGSGRFSITSDGETAAHGIKE